jgi:putative transposase
MSKKSNYISTNRSKHYLKCHLIFVCKYRKKLLTGQLNDDVKHIFQTIANGSDFEIEVMETDLDHIHFLIRYIPRWSIAQIVRRLKQQSTFKHLAVTLYHTS